MQLQNSAVIKVADRISIQFRNGEQKSVVLFSHLGGLPFKEEAESYAESLSASSAKRVSTPLSHLEPATVMVEYIRRLTYGMDAVEYDLYLGVDEHDGDNSDNGHFIIDLNDPSNLCLALDQVDADDGLTDDDRRRQTVDWSP